MIRRELPIIFTAESVRAILANRKSQTRRIVTPEVPEGCWLESVDSVRFQCFRIRPDALNPAKPQWPGQNDIDLGLGWRRPRFRVGDVLWAKETWRTEELDPNEYDGDGIRFRADGLFRPIENTQAAAMMWLEAHREGNAWRSPLYMPRWASRISLEVTEVRAQRVQEISEEDAVAEGFAGSEVETPREQFASAWDVINGRKANWSSNPWVFAYTFRRIEK